MSELREDERAFLTSQGRCEHCEHLEALHWDTQEDSGCSLPECVCTGMSVDVTGYLPPDPNNPIPRIWSSEIVSAASPSVLRGLIDRSFEDDMNVGHVITVTRAQYGAMNSDGTWDVQDSKP